MRNLKARFAAFLVIFFYLTITLYSKEPIKLSISTNLYKDLSDTYGTGGKLFSGELAACKKYCGINLCFGHYQSQSTHNFKILIEETEETFEIPIEEMAIMQIGSISTFLRPLQNEWIQTDILFGLVLGYAKNSSFKSVDYKYSLSEGKITYLSRDYQLINKKHFGYQFGFNVSFYPTKKIGLQINARLQDLSNGGTFFLLGGGICLQL